MFGLTEEQVSGFGMTFGIGAFMLYMLFLFYFMFVIGKMLSKCMVVITRNN